MRVGLASDPLFLAHRTGPGHPERPERIPAVLAALEGLPLVRVEARDATRDELATVHDRAYLGQVEARILKGEMHLDPDTVVCTESHAAAVRAAGAALALGEAFLAGAIDSGFAAVRPPGHHACRARAMGFCIFNNAALLARFLHGRGRRVAVVDWDVHHGNGTQDILWDEPAIGYLSLHEHPLYPGTGFRHEVGQGNIRNVPLPGGMGDAEYLAAFEREALPWIGERDPDVIVVSAGFDAHARDPLAGMRLTEGAYGRLTRLLRPRPILSVLEGGYDLAALGASARKHVEALG